jgi:hypothetical protein
VAALTEGALGNAPGIAVAGAVAVAVADPVAVGDIRQLQEEVELARGDEDEKIQCQGRRPTCCGQLSVAHLRTFSSHC